MLRVQGTLSTLCPESPTYTQGSFLFRAGACHDRSWGRKKSLGAILGLARALQQRFFQQGSFHEQAIKAALPTVWL